MANSKKASRSRNSIKKEVAREITDSLADNCFHDNPIKRQIKLKQFPWTQKQKEFFKIALHPDTKVILVNGPAGTSKTLLATYCALQLLNMKSISDIMYLRSAVESSDRSLGFLPGSAEEKLRFFNLPFLDKGKSSTVLKKCLNFFLIKRARVKALGLLSSGKKML